MTRFCYVVQMLLLWVAIGFDAAVIVYLAYDLLAR